MDSFDLIDTCEKNCAGIFKQIDDVALYNQNKVLNAFIKNKIALRHFSPTTGYGYDDTGRDTLNALFSDIFNTESAIVTPLIASGTHAISLMLHGILRPSDSMLSITGMPYDTLSETISGEGVGSLKDYNIGFKKIDLLDGVFNEKEILNEVSHKPKLIFIQRSRGYSWRKSLSVDEIKNIIDKIRKIHPDAIIAVDNCYGEFCEKSEPTDAGADLIAGSLIKNPGGGLAPTGGYIAGKKNLIEQTGYRLTAPGIGCEVGSYAHGYREFYQGLFLAPHTTAQSLKGSVLFGAAFEKLGFETLPKPKDKCSDIIRSIKFNNENELILFCQAIQKSSPIDSFAVPYPWDMPGYSHKVIMAAGAFVQGASIELSADAPIKEPYIAYLQGGLTYEHVKIALSRVLNELNLI